MVDELNAEIASLSAELRRARDQLVLLNDGILPQARTGLSSATVSYQVGRVDFLTLLDAQVTLYRRACTPPCASPRRSGSAHAFVVRGAPHR
jgi:outer membrane protein TolC